MVLKSLLIVLCGSLAASAGELETRLIEAYERLERSLETAPKLVEAYQPEEDTDITDPATDAETILKALPFVESVKVIRPKEKPTKRLIVLENWHAVPLNLLIEDLESQLERKLTERELILQTWVHAVEVEAVQVQLMAVLSCLADFHDLKQVWNEGLTDDADSREYADLISKVALAIEYKAKRDGRGQAETVKQNLKAVRGITDQTPVDRLAELQEREADRFFILTAGPVLRMRRKLKAGHPEDSDLIDAAAPQFDEGKPLYDPAALKAREDYIVRTMFKRDSVAVLLMGGSHDFSDNLKEFDPKTELIVLKVKAYSEIAD